MPRWAWAAGIALVLAGGAPAHGADPPGRVFRDCPECPEMVVIPPGSFTMGSPENEELREDRESPQRRVTIAASFAMGKYEVTFDEWGACVVGGGCSVRPADNGWPADAGMGRGRRPVINVSWDDAQQYVRWLSRKTGKRYRLPSEAEWEFAARAGTTTPFHAGQTISTDQANYNGEYAYGPGRPGVFRRQTLPVGSFAANRFGLHDMSGNVAEWVEDCWNDHYRGAPGDGRARLDGNCSRRMIRGGSWYSFPNELRSAVRNLGRPEFRNFTTGFRVARTQ